VYECKGQRDDECQGTCVYVGGQRVDKCQGEWEVRVRISTREKKLKVHREMQKKKERHYVYMQETETETNTQGINWSGGRKMNEWINGMRWERNFGPVLYKRDDLFFSRNTKQKCNLNATKAER
jgi:hypothetical protein